MTQTREFVRMLQHPNYEIMVDFPHTIRRIDNKCEVKEWEDGRGYICVNMYETDKKRIFKKHRLIAGQFIPNPNNLPVIDHINHDKKDNRISNLRWVSSSTNNYNKSSHFGYRYEFVDDLPEDVIIIDFYETRTEIREFEDNRYYYYYNEDSNEDVFYGRINENVYKILHINTCRNGSRFVSLMDTNNKAVSVVINRFKQQYDLI